MSHQLAEGRKESRRILQRRFLKANRGVLPATLFQFLRVLLSHHTTQELTATEARVKSLATAGKKRDAIAAMMRQIATGKRIISPQILRGMFKIRELRGAVARYKSQVRKINRTNPPTKMRPDWNECAVRFMAGIPIHDPPATPWDRVVGKLIGKCRIAGIDEVFLREWVAGEGDSLESDARTAELARFGRHEIDELLADLRESFPQEMNEWFGSITTVPEALVLEIVAGGLRFGNATVDLSGKPLACIRKLLDATQNRLDWMTLRDRVWGQEGDTSYTEKGTIKNTIKDARDALRKLARKSGIRIDPRYDPLPCVERGRDLAWKLNFPG